MFVALAKIIEAGTTLTIQVMPAPAGEIMVMVATQPKEGQDIATLPAPLVITGTPAELDEHLAAQLTKYATTRLSLEEQMSNALLVMATTHQAQQDEAVQKLKKNGGKPSPVKTSTHVAASGEDEENMDEQIDGMGISTPPPTYTRNSSADLSLF